VFFACSSRTARMSRFFCALRPSLSSFPLFPLLSSPPLPLFFSLSPLPRKDMEEYTKKKRIILAVQNGLPFPSSPSPSPFFQKTRKESARNPPTRMACPPFFFPLPRKNLNTSGLVRVARVFFLSFPPFFFFFPPWI